MLLVTVCGKSRQDNECEVPSKLVDNDWEAVVADRSCGLVQHTTSKKLDERKECEDGKR